MPVPDLGRDIRVGFRVLVKERGFCALAIIVLALGISGVTTMFSVVNGVLLRGFSFPHADRLVTVNFIDSSTATFFGVNGQVSTLDFQDFAEQQKSYDALAQYLSGSTVNVTINGQPQRYTGAYITEKFLRIVGVPPMMGRDFTAADNVQNAPKVALIGYAMWQRDFGADPNVVGKGVRVNGKPATIVGVMPKGFAFPVNEQIWIPLYTDFPPKQRNDPTATNPAVMGRLKDGVTIDQANAEATMVANRLAATYPDTNKRFNTGQVQPLLAAFTSGPLRGTLWTMLAFCVGVLLIACVNVMNMQFARATLRAKELAVRSSLGASRMRIVRQMLTESLLVAVIGGVIGVALAYASIDWLRATVFNSDNPPPYWMSFDVDAPVLVLTILATFAAAVLSGLLPAWMASRANVVQVLREGGRGNTSRTVNLVSRGLVVFQIVVTCILLVGSLLQVRSITNQQTLDYGYDTSGLLTARMGLMDGDYPTPAARKIFFDRLVRELQSDTAFDSVAVTNRFRMVFSGAAAMELEGREYRDPKDRPTVNFEQVSPAYFDVTAQKLLEGRAFRDDDLDTRQPVAIVNAAFARKYFGNASPIGRHFRTVANNQQAGPWRTIIGVVSTVRMLGPFNQPGVDETGFYVPFYASPVGPAAQEPLAPQFATVVVKPRGGQHAETLAPALRHDVQKVDPNLPLYFVGTPQAQIDTFVSQNRVIATLFSAFGIVAMVLAAVGIYGVMSFAVNQRRQEFGVRMALGAQYTRILRMVLSQGAIQIGGGLFIGLALALAFAKLAGSGMQGILFGVSPLDPATYASVTALVITVSLAATLVPARRAMRVDPIVALRAE